MRFFIVVAALVFLPLAVAPAAATSFPPLRVGFTEGGGHESLAAAESAINGSIFLNFCCPLSLSDGAPGVTNIRVLRYNAACPTMVMSNCLETIPQLVAFVVAQRGVDPLGFATWELGNEPGNPGQDSLTGFATWENAVYQAIKGANRNSVVLGPGVLNWDANQLALYNTLSFDVVAFHVYPPDYCMGPQWVPEARQYIAGAASLGIITDKPVFLTEISDWPFCSGSDAVRGANVAAVKESLQRANVAAAVWYTEGDLHQWNGFLFNTDNSLTAEGAAWKN